MKYAIELAILASFAAVGIAANTVGGDKEALAMTEAPPAQTFAQTSPAQPAIGFDEAFTTGLSFGGAPKAPPEQTTSSRPQQLASAAQSGPAPMNEAILRKVTNDDIARMKAAGIGMTGDLGPVQASVAL